MEGIVPEKYADDGDDPESGDSYEPEEVVIESLINVDTDSMEKDVYKKNVLENSPTKLNILDLRPEKYKQINGFNAILPTTSNSEKQQGQMLDQDQSEYILTGNNYADVPVRASKTHGHADACPRKIF